MYSQDEVNTYLTIHNTTLTRIANELNITLYTLSRILNGKQHASNRLAKRLEAYTKGYFKAERFTQPPTYCPTCKRKHPQKAYLEKKLLGINQKVR